MGTSCRQQAPQPAPQAIDSPRSAADAIAAPTTAPASSRNRGSIRCGRVGRAGTMASTFTGRPPMASVRRLIIVSGLARAGFFLLLRCPICKVTHLFPAEHLLDLQRTALICSIASSVEMEIIWLCTSLTRKSSAYLMHFIVAMLRNLLRIYNKSQKST